LVKAGRGREDKAFSLLKKKTDCSQRLKEVNVFSEVEWSGVRRGAVIE
jgi:hypothetical protein